MAAYLDALSSSKSKKKINCFIDNCHSQQFVEDFFCLQDDICTEFYVLKNIPHKIIPLKFSRQTQEL